MPALPLDEPGVYVAVAFLVTRVVSYLAIFGSKPTRMSSQLEELADRVPKDADG
jgi:hypothetical protein